MNVLGQLVAGDWKSRTFVEMNGWNDEHTIKDSKGYRVASFYCHRDDSGEILAMDFYLEPFAKNCPESHSRGVWHYEKADSAMCRAILDLIPGG